MFGNQLQRQAIVTALKNRITAFIDLEKPVNRDSRIKITAVVNKLRERNINNGI